jgi:uncharacterized MAPEG superfamily protein
MTIELATLAFSVLLGLAHIVLASHSASLQRGYRWTASARDAVIPPLTGIAGRLERAQRNYLETFTFFAAAVMIANVAGRHDWMTILGTQLYFWGRVAYLAAYASGVPLLRSLIWNVATLGIVLILIALI